MASTVLPHGGDDPRVGETGVVNYGSPDTLHNESETDRSSAAFQVSVASTATASSTRRLEKPARAEHI
jgi:hypothetical protein